MENKRPLFANENIVFFFIEDMPYLIPIILHPIYYETKEISHLTTLLLHEYINTFPKQTLSIHVLFFHVIGFRLINFLGYACMKYSKMVFLDVLKVWTNFGVRVFFFTFSLSIFLGAHFVSYSTVEKEF